MPEQGSNAVTTLKKVVILCHNSAGEPEFWTCAVEVTDEDIENGRHYELAKENAEYNAYEEPMIAFDADDQAAKQLIETGEWIQRPA